MKKIETMIFEVVKQSTDYSGLTQMEYLEKNIPSVFDKNNENILVLNDDQIDKLVEEISFLKDSDFVKSRSRKILWIDWLSKDQLNKVVDSLVKNKKVATTIKTCLKQSSNEEDEAAGRLFGWENLGVLTKIVKQKVWEFAKKQEWSKIIRLINQEMHSIAESDEMLEGFIEEINSWIKRMKTDKETQKMWEEFKKSGT
jgi:hypothetical protein